MFEAMPTDLELLDTYQGTVRQQISYDEGARTVRGYPPEVYMYLGIREELRETWDADQHHPHYNRLGALLLMPGGSDKAMPGEVTAKAIDDHRNEFGDVSWYLANLLGQYGVQMSTAVRAGVVARETEVNNQPKCAPEFCVEVERQFPFFDYLGYLQEMNHSIECVLRADTPEAIEILRDTAGVFILSMSLVATNRLDTTYQAILDANIAKIDCRIAEGTIYDKSKRNE